jgi:hypothetical protein
VVDEVSPSLRLRVCNLRPSITRDIYRCAVVRTAQGKVDGLIYRVEGVNCPLDILCSNDWKLWRWPNIPSQRAREDMKLQPVPPNSCSLTLVILNNHNEPTRLLDFDDVHC